MEIYNSNTKVSSPISRFLFDVDAEKFTPSISDRILLESLKPQSTFSNTPLDNNLPFSQLNVYEGLVQIKELFPTQRSSSPPIRTIGDIAEFSKGSRSRAFKWLLTLNTNSLSEAIFVTLTYHNESIFEIGNCKTHLEAFLRKLKSHIPECVYIWRMETQIRGTPHFHLIVWSKHSHVRLYTQLQAMQLSKDWLAIKSCRCNNCKRYSVNVREVRNRRNAIAYLSKYCAKVTDTLHESKNGKFWGTSFDAPRKPMSEIYLTKCQHDKLKLLLKKFLFDRKITFPFCLTDESFNDSYSLFIDASEFVEILLSSMPELLSG